MDVKNMIIIKKIFYKQKYFPNPKNVKKILWYEKYENYYKLNKNV